MDEPDVPAGSDPTSAFGGPMPTEPGPPRRRRFVLLGPIATVVVVAAAVVAVQLGRSGGDAEATPLSLAFTAGASASYRIHMRMDATVAEPSLGSLPFTMDLSERVTWTVSDVAPDGTATVDVSATDVSGTVDGTPVSSSSLSSPSFTIRISRDGRVLTAGGLSLPSQADSSGFGFPGMGQFTPLLPDGKVAPGDSWDRSFSQAIPFGSGSIRYTTHSNFLGYEDVQGVHAAVVSTHLEVPMDFTLRLSEMLNAFGSNGDLGGADAAALRDASITYGGRGTFVQKAWVDPRAEQMLKSSSEGSFDMTMAFAGVPDLPLGTVHFTGTFTQTVERV
jgi:hypothetical protein